jgi:hypothetical protein
MRRMLTMGFALAIITVSSLSVDAGYYRRSSKPCPNCGKYHVYYVQTAKDKNVFQKMMELERRKNAWLKRTFFGR